MSVISSLLIPKRTLEAVSRRPSKRGPATQLWHGWASHLAWLQQAFHVNLSPTGCKRIILRYPQWMWVKTWDPMPPANRDQYVGLHGRNTEAIHHEVTNKSSSVSSTPNLFSLWIVWFVKMPMLQTFRNRQDNTGKFAAYVHIELC